MVVATEPLKPKHVIFLTLCFLYLNLKRPEEQHQLENQESLNAKFQDKEIKKIHYYMWFAEMNNVNIYSGDWIIFQSHSVLKDTFRY